MNKRISFSTAGLYPRDTLESIKLLKNMGYYEVEIMPQCKYEITKEFAKKVSNEGIHVSSYHFPLVLFSTFYNQYFGMVEESKEMCKELAQSGNMLGTEFIVIHPPYNGKYEDKVLRETVINNIRYLAEVCADQGIKVALENNPDSKAKSPEGLLKEIKTINHANVYPMVDTTESYEAGVDPVEFINKVDPKHMHLSDYKGESKHILPGFGEFDWEDIVESLKKFNYNGCYVIEPSYRYMTDDVCDKLANLKTFFDNLI